MARLEDETFFRVVRALVPKKGVEGFKAVAEQLKVPFAVEAGPGQKHWCYSDLGGRYTPLPRRKFIVAIGGPNQNISAFWEELEKQHPKTQTVEGQAMHPTLPWRTIFL